ncbi:hypothetical protein QF037_008395 [Streptomyces canus]|uniref:hypothetical protein n=1 Tax=Streptomyces canus TaxID=58343 RepID=UPI00277E6F80|nr:hypothetical protein [Streptomyces canus]
MATADDPDQRATTAGPPTVPPGTDLQSLAVQLRRMNGEINRLVHGFAGEHGLHATDARGCCAVWSAPAA